MVNFKKQYEIVSCQLSESNKLATYVARSNSSIIRFSVLSRYLYDLKSKIYITISEEKVNDQDNEYMVVSCNRNPRNKNIEYELHSSPDLYLELEFRKDSADTINLSFGKSYYITICG